MSSAEDQILNRLHELAIQDGHPNLTMHSDQGNVQGSVKTTVHYLSQAPPYPEDGMLTREVSYFFGFQATLLTKNIPGDLKGKMRSREILIQAVPKGVGNNIGIVQASPVTFVGSHTSSDSLSYGVSGNIGFFGEDPTIGISGSATVTSGESRNIPDVSVIQYIPSDDNNSVRFKFLVNDSNSDAANSASWADVQAVFRVDGINPFLEAYLDNRTTYDDVQKRSVDIRKHSYSFNFVVTVTEKHDGGDSISRPFSVPCPIPFIFTPNDFPEKFFDSNPQIPPIDRTYKPSPTYIGDKLIFDPYYDDGGGNNTLQSDIGNKVYTALISNNEKYTCALIDGNLVVKRSNAGYIWASNTNISNSFFALQNDKNLVIYGSSVFGIKKWSNQGPGSSQYSQLLLKDNGDLVQLDQYGNTLWSSISDLARQTVYVTRPNGPKAYDIFATTHNNDVCIVHSGLDSAKLYLAWSSNLKDWNETEVSGNTASTANVASFKGWLYVIYKSNDSNDILTVKTQNYTDWTQNSRLPTYQTVSAVGVGVLGNYMYILHRGSDGNLYSIRTSDGENWGELNNIIGQSAFTVTLATFKNKLYMVYSGEKDSQLYVSWTSNGKDWEFKQIEDQNANIVGLAASDNWMYMAYSGAHDSNIYVSQTNDGITWSPSQALDDQHGSSTAATFVNGRFVIVYSSKPEINVMAYTQ